MRCTKLGPDIWRCSIKPEDIKYLKIKDVFWEDVLKSWSQFNYYYHRNIENQIIWYNSAIRVGGKPVRWDNCYQEGLVYVHQLFEGGEFISAQKAWELYKLSKIRFNSLKSALPRDWKAFFQKENKKIFLPLQPHNYDKSIIM